MTSLRLHKLQTKKRELQVDNLHLDDQFSKIRHKFALVVMTKIKSNNPHESCLNLDKICWVNMLI